MTLTERTCQLINRHRVIALKRADGWYLGQHTNIAAGLDAAHWSWRPDALHLDDLELAFLLAPYFGCKVVSFCVGKKS